MTADEQRAIWREKTRRWRAANPERNREVARRAMAKYLAPKVAAARTRRETRATERTEAERQRGVLAAERRRLRDETRLVGPEYDRAYYAAHREQRMVTTARWKKANPERRREHKRRYFQKHPEVRIMKHRADHLRGHGLTVGQYDAMLAAQGGVCAICRKAETRIDKASGRVISLGVDHDHACCPGQRSCGECVRGLLCDSCNSGIGRLKDSVEIVTAALAYLAHHGLTADT